MPEMVVFDGVAGKLELLHKVMSSVDTCTRVPLLAFAKVLNRKL